MSNSNDIIVEQTNHVLRIVLNRPTRANALTFDNMQDLAALLLDAGSDPGVRVVVLSGSGKAFCSGADLHSMDDNQALAPTAAWWRDQGREGAMRLTLALAGLEKPVIAEVNGAAAGGGVGLALLCDFVYLAESARLVFAFTGRGLVPDCGVTWTLPRLVGRRVATELCLNAQSVDSSRAVELGLATATVPSEQLRAVVDDHALALSRGAGVALRLTKRLLIDAETMGIEQSLRAEFSAQATCLVSHDAAEGARAFIDKRPPEFKSA